MPFRLSRSFLAAVLIALLFPCCLHAQERNAADLYHQALKALPTDPTTVEQLHGYEQISIEGGRRVIAALGGVTQPVLEAAQAAQCDWKISAAGDPNLSFLTPARTLSEVIALQARISAADGKLGDSMKLLAAAMLMGRRIQQIPFPLARVVGEAIQGSAMNNAAIYIPQADKASLNAITSALKVPVTIPSIDEVVNAEFQTSRYRNAPQAAEQRARLASGLKNTGNANAAYTALLSAAIAWRLEGDEALKKAADPFGNGPFAVRKWEGGFELKSKLTVKGRAVSMIVGKER